MTKKIKKTEEAAETKKTVAKKAAVKKTTGKKTVTKKAAGKKAAEKAAPAKSTLSELKEKARAKAAEKKAKKAATKGVRNGKYADIKLAVFNDWKETEGGTNTFSKKEAAELHKKHAFAKDGTELVGLETLYRWLYRWKVGKEVFPIGVEESTGK